jgi:hypothetical protein
LPSGVVFELGDTTRNVYLHHRSEVGEFFLSSDAVVPTLARQHRISHIINQIPLEEREAFHGIGYTIGGMMVFPGQPRRSQDNNQRCARFPSQDQGSIRSNGGVHPAALQQRTQSVE